jgi:hypothetical protein
MDTFWNANDFAALVKNGQALMDFMPPYDVTEMKQKAK